MNDDLKLQVSRGVRAKRLLADEMVQEAFASVEKTIEEGWKNSRAGDEEGRHNAYIMHRIYLQFRGEFEKIVRDGKHAKSAIDRLKSKIRRVI